MSDEDIKNVFKIREIKTKNDKVKQCRFVKSGIGMKHPFKCYACAPSGGGKSTAILNMLKYFYIKEDGTSWFDKIYIFSQTKIACDPIYEILGLPEHHFFNCNIHALRMIMEIQEKQIKEKGLQKSDKVMIVLDDFISDVKFTNQLLEIFIAVRKYNISLFVLSQAFHQLPKPCRIQMTSILFWKLSQKDISVLADDFCAPGYSKKKFMKVVDYCCKEKYSFMFIDLNRDLQTRYRKNLSEIVIR